jgi:hypothetical protein
LVKIENLPLLISSLLVSINNNTLSFFVLGSIYWDNLVVCWVDKLSISELEYLEPLWISAPDLHVVGSTSRLDVPWLVIQSSSDGLWLLMEVPDLSLSSIWSLDDHVPVIDKVEISIAWHSRDNIEISFNIESELLVQFSLSWLIILIYINNLPLLS